MELLLRVVIPRLGIVGYAMRMWPNKAEIAATTLPKCYSCAHAFGDGRARALALMSACVQLAFNKFHVS